METNAGLPARRERPDGYTAAKKYDEFPPPHGGLPPTPLISFRPSPEVAIFLEILEGPDKSL